MRPAASPSCRTSSLAIEAGPPLLVIGPNGAGKSVLLRLLHGLLAPSAGRDPLGGRRAARPAMVFQRPVMLRRTALANLEYPLALAGLPRAARRARAAAALEAGRPGGAGRPAGAAAFGRRAAAPGAGPRRGPGAGGAVPRRALRQPGPGGDPAVEAAIAGIAARGTKIVMTTHDLPRRGGWPARSPSCIAAGCSNARRRRRSSPGRVRPRRRPSCAANCWPDPPRRRMPPRGDAHAEPRPVAPVP